jgi:hypothetical protein
VERSNIKAVIDGVKECKQCKPAGDECSVADGVTSAPAVSRLPHFVVSRCARGPGLSACN